MKTKKQVLVINNWDEFISNAEKYKNKDGVIPLEKAAQFKMDWHIENRIVDEDCCAIFSGREICD